MRVKVSGWWLVEVEEVGRKAGQTFGERSVRGFVWRLSR